jgi:hypothetical protein
MKPDKPPMRKFRVKYANLVVMETVVEARSADEVRDAGLPGAFDGIPTEMIGKHVEDVRYHGSAWDVSEIP